MLAEAAFLNAVRDAPRDDAPRLIYADWLSEQPLPSQQAKAEFIRVEIALAALDEGSPEWTALDRRRRTLRREFHSIWQSPLARLGATILEYDRGLPSRLALTPDVLVAADRRLAELAPGWTAATVSGLGSTLVKALKRPLPVNVASIALALADDHEFAGRAETNARNLAASPWLRQVETLSLWGDNFGPSLERIVAAASAMKASRLRALRLGGNEIDSDLATALSRYSVFGSLHLLELRDNPLGDGLSELLAACRPETLQSLSFTPESTGDVAAIADSPLALTLEELYLSGPYYEVGVRPLFESPTAFPSLRRLTLAEGLRMTAEDLRLASGEPIPGAYFASLVELDLSGVRLDDAAVAALVASPIVDHLRCLDLSATRVSDAGARAIAGSSRLGALRRLRLADSGVSPAGVRAMKASPGLSGLLDVQLTRE